MERKEGINGHGFLVGDQVVSQSKSSMDWLGEVGKISNYGIHVRFQVGDKLLHQVFHFNPIHHTQSPISEIKHKTS